ncbi:hypothetical protein ACWENQ_45645 [Nonomuraea sp. NPDC004354]
MIPEGAVCEHCGSAKADQASTEARPFDTLMITYQCQDCGESWNVWY